MKIKFFTLLSGLLLLGGLFVAFFTNRSPTARDALILKNVAVLARGENDINPNARHCFKIIGYNPDWGIPVTSGYYCGDCTIVPYTHYFDGSICFLK